MNQLPTAFKKKNMNLCKCCCNLGKHPFHFYMCDTFLAGQDQVDIEFPGYWLDGWVAPDHPAIRMGRGVQHHLVPTAFLMGATSRDGVLGTDYIAAQDLPTTAEVPEKLREFFSVSVSNLFGKKLKKRHLVANLMDFYEFMSLKSIRFYR